MISALVPRGVVVSETCIARLSEKLLLPEERAQLGPGAVAKRRQEFATGRVCARRALQTLGVPAIAIPSGAHREPVWPAGIVGSITHCAGYAAAAVAAEHQFAAIGIDAEVNAALAAGVAEMVCTPAELRWAQSAADIGAAWPTLIFSAKESLYKAWFPLAGRWLDFEDAELTLDPDRGTFQVELRVPLPPQLGDRPAAFVGRFGVTHKHVFTAVTVAADDGAR